MQLARIITRKRQTAVRAASIMAPAGPAIVTDCPRTWDPLPEPAGAQPLVDPPLEPRDEAIALLHATAEVEHSLMVQYLYAGYSLGRVDESDPRYERVRLIGHLLQHIAREEMAHFATMQNLLHLLGAPLHFDREQSPFASDLLPFRFKLEPLSLGSLAKYVIAESPRPLPGDGSLTDDEIKRIHGEVTNQAKASNDGICPGHVGDIFARLIWLFRNGLQDRDFRRDTQRSQAEWADWGFEPKRRSLDGVSLEAEQSLVRQFSGSDPGVLRSAALDALMAIAEQGEGVDPGGAGKESHFEWFWLLYRKFAELQQMPGKAPILQIPINPNTTFPRAHAIPSFKMVDAGLEAATEAGRISNPRARRWAQLFNIRYRILLAELHHFLRIDTALYDANGDRLARGYLAIGVFNEMRRLKKIANKLVQLPKDQTDDPHRAGPPFELPYTTQLPDGEPNRWDMHLSTSHAAGKLVSELLDSAEDGSDEFLLDLKAADEQDQATMAALASGKALPPQTQDFPKVVRILEEAVRGFAIQPRHGKFWANAKRQDVLDAVQHPITPGDGPNSNLVKALRGALAGTSRMPRERPPVPESRINYVERWATAGAPDSTPEYGGLAPERDPRAEPVAAPPPPPPSFAGNIRPLFRDSDVSCMKAIADFDLSKFDDVKANAPGIFARLDNGSMPTDGRWPQADIDLFRAWIASGFSA